MSRSKSKRVAGRARKEGGGDGTPLLMTIIGNPEIVRLKWLGVLAPDAMASEREALTGRDDRYHVAAPDELTADFHRRIRALVIANAKPYPIIGLGCAQNGKPPMQDFHRLQRRPSTPVLSADAAPEGSRLN